MLSLIFTFDLWDLIVFFFFPGWPPFLFLQGVAAASFLFGSGLLFRSWKCVLIVIFPFNSLPLFPFFFPSECLGYFSLKWAACVVLQQPFQSNPLKLLLEI